MPTFDIPFFGNLVLTLTLVVASYSMVVAIGAGRGRAHLLPAARFGAWATIGFTLVATLTLAYAFQTHDFRIRYVARYSDRSMGDGYLFAALWGGQDGSLLWWTCLLGGYTGAVLLWTRGRLRELQPWIFAVLMSIMVFFLVLMLFAANPFTVDPVNQPLDGNGLNPLLQNYWMSIHPPTLYLGFVGWSVPFAFAVAALATGRLGNEWIKAARVWTMIAWLFLSIGLLLGCVWSYEELGWGGYWAWDPVENASFMPWLIGTAFLHSATVQERYGMLKVWNLFLICLTYFMTIFGTFLTRSGLISSVHAFAKSDIGVYFRAYMIVLVIFCIVLIVWRAPKLKAEHRIQSLLSREFVFLFNNWILLSMTLFVLGATLYPRISEFVRGQEATVGPPFYNVFMTPFGLVLLVLTGVGPLIAWRKATAANLMRSLRVPLLVGAAMFVLHIALGSSIGMAPVVDADPIFDSNAGLVLAKVMSVAPLLSTTICAFVFACIAQEFVRGTGARMRGKGESAFTALLRLMSRARRRYGGYLVHIGVVLMILGFTGAAYDIEDEAALRPGQSMHIAGYELRYEGPRRETDPNKQMIFADMAVISPTGAELGKVSPAKFIYRTHPQMPTTEVYIRTRPSEDLYVILSTVDPQTKRATIRAVVRPLVMWVWIGGLLLIFGSIFAIWPTTQEVLARIEQGKARRARMRAAAAASAATMSLALLFMQPAHVHAQDSSSLHAGTVIMHDPVERKLFSRLLCECGDCERLALDSCACSWADERRTEIRESLASGAPPADIEAQYRARFGPASIAIPSDKGMDRALWVIPVVLIVIAAGAIVWVGRRWKAAGEAQTATLERSAQEDGGETSSGYDARLDEELERLDREQS